MYNLPLDTVAGLIYFSKYLDTTKDIVISFDYSCYGPTVSGSEGFCVFFADTFNPTVIGGGAGPGLGYSSVSGISTDASNINILGMPSAIMGVGFDITGNFGSNQFFNSGDANPTPNSITLRNNYQSDYNFITKTTNLNNIMFGNTISLYQQINQGQTPIYKRVRVRLTDFGQRIVIDIKKTSDTSFTNYLDYNFQSYNNSLSSTPTLSGYTVKWPPSVLCGLAFTTGEIMNTTFKIKGFNINGNTTTVISQGTYTYNIDTNTLPATLDYKSPNNNLVRYDVLSAINIDPYGVMTRPVLTDPSRPLVIVSPSGGPVGVPYVPVIDINSGDTYLNIT